MAEEQSQRLGDARGPSVPLLAEGNGQQMRNTSVRLANAVGETINGGSNRYIQGVRSMRLDRPSLAQPSWGTWCSDHEFIGLGPLQR